MHDETPIDPVALERLRAWGGEKLVREMARLYRENARARLTQIEDGVASMGELAEAHQGAHSLKSSAANVGAVAVSDLAREIEDRARAGDRMAAGALLDDLRHALEAADLVLRKLSDEEAP